MKTWIITLILVVIVGAIIAVNKKPERSDETANLTINDEIINISDTTMEIKSRAFGEGGNIPSKYTCDGGNTIPPLEITNIPEKALSLSLIIDDPDIPDFVKQSRGIEVFDHWVIFNIPVSDGASEYVIDEGKEPEGILGVNSSGENKYTGPCPPDKEHRYFFKVYALDSILSLSAGASKAEVERSMEGHIVNEAVLIGKYERK